MKLILDTHCWIWSFACPDRLGEEAREILEDRSHTLYLSAASSWEIAIKHRLGKLSLPQPPELFVPARMARDGIESLSIKHVHALRVASLPDHHRDPFDRLLVAQAQVERLPIMTADTKLPAYDVEIIPAR